MILFFTFLTITDLRARQMNCRNSPSFANTGLQNSLVRTHYNIVQTPKIVLLRFYKRQTESFKITLTSDSRNQNGKPF